MNIEGKSCCCFSISTDLKGKQCDYTSKSTKAVIVVHSICNKIAKTKSKMSYVE